MRCRTTCHDDEPRLANARWLSAAWPIRLGGHGKTTMRRPARRSPTGGPLIPASKPARCSPGPVEALAAGRLLARRQRECGWRCGRFFLVLLRLLFFAAASQLTLGHGVIPHVVTGPV